VTNVVTTHYPISLTTLPASWTSTTVGEAISNIQPGFASGIHNQEGLGIPHLRPMNVDREGRLDLSTVKYVSGSNPLRVTVGDVLFNNTNSAELIGKTAYIGISGGFAFSNHMTRLRTATGINPRFMAYQLHFLWMSGYFQHRCTHHVNQASVASRTLADSVPFAVAPAKEQTRIADEIEKQFTRLDAAVAALKRVQANLKRYRAAVLKAACEGRLVPTEAELARREGRSYEPASVLLDRILAERRARWEAVQLASFRTSGKKATDDKWKLQYKEPAVPDRSESLPDGWTWATAEQLSYRITDGTHQPPQFVDSGVPFLFVRHIVRGTISFDDTKFISEKTFRRLNERCPVEIGDILYSAVGSYGTAVLVTMNPQFSFQRHIAHLKPSMLLSNAYFVHCLNSPLGLSQAHKFARGVAQKTVTLGDLGKFAIALPPLIEQLRIAEEIDRRLSVIGEIEMQVAGNSTRSERLRQGILKHAFEGKLVPQDPNDEPAAALLERIRAEQETRKLGNAVGVKRKGRVLQMTNKQNTLSRSIIEALRDTTAGMSPEALLRATGHGADSIDKFYAELKQQVEAGFVEEIRSDEDVLLRAVNK